MFIQFEDNLFRRNFEMLMGESDVLYDRDGDLILLCTNKKSVKSLLDAFIGEDNYEYASDGKLGKMNKFVVRAKKRLRVLNVRGGSVISDPYPEPCKIFELEVDTKELANRDSRSRALTWFLNACLGHGSYKGVDANKAIFQLCDLNVISAIHSNNKVSIKRLKFEEEE